jgi:pimeloyl-ACP methyl ester carboxylesterase
VDWAAEAGSVLAGVAAARRDPAAVHEQTRTLQPRWSDRDCQQAVHDLASSGADEIAAGLRQGSHWPSLEAARRTVPTLVLAAAEVPVSIGVGAGPADATVLRGPDRAAARQVADAFVELDGGHCLHRDQPDAWLRAILDFTG